MHRQFYNTVAPVTRRNFILTAAAVAGRSGVPARLLVPVHRIMDSRAQCSPEQLHQFWYGIWPEAVRNFGRGGIELQTSDGPGEVRRSPGDVPIFVGLRRGVINLVLTDHIPMKWDNGRAQAGVTTIHDGYHLCLVALQYAHGDQVPFLSTNTCAVAGRLREAAEVVPDRRTGIPHRLVRHPTRVIPQWRRRPAIGAGISTAPAIDRRDQ
jgi:hypothetical protein